MHPTPYFPFLLPCADEHVTSFSCHTLACLLPCLPCPNGPFLSVAINQGKTSLPYIDLWSYYFITKAEKLLIHLPTASNINRTVKIPDAFRSASIFNLFESRFEIVGSASGCTSSCVPICPWLWSFLLLVLSHGRIQIIIL